MHRCHIWGTWERRYLDTLLSIRSANQGLGRAMYCLAKWTQRTWEISTDCLLWKVTLRPQQREAPPNRRGPTPPRPTTSQLCPYMVAARLMALLWPGPDTPTENYPHLTEEDMPGETGTGTGHYGINVESECTCSEMISVLK